MTIPPSFPPAPWGAQSRLLLHGHGVQRPEPLCTVGSAAPPGTARAPLCPLYPEDETLLPIPSSPICSPQTAAAWPTQAGTAAEGGGRGEQARRRLRADLYIYLQEGESRAGLGH